MAGSPDDPVRLSPFQRITKLTAAPIEYLAFSIDLGAGIPGEDIVGAACGSPGPATGAASTTWSLGYSYPFNRSSNVHGYANGEWLPGSVVGVSIEGLPYTESVIFGPATVVGQVFQEDFSRISPVTGGSGIVVPGSSLQFSSDTSAYAELLAILLDGAIYCADVAPLDDGIGQLAANAISESRMATGPTSSILSHVSVTFRGNTWPAVGSCTVPRTPPVFPTLPEGIPENGMPKTLWCLFANPES